MRSVRPEEEPYFDGLIGTHNCLGIRKFCGKRRRRVAVGGERWVALIGWHRVILHCGARIRWIGWTSLQRCQRLFLVCNLPATSSTTALPNF